MDKIRIMYFIGTLSRGGAEGQLIELMKGLDRSFFEPALVVLKGRDELYDICLEHGINPVFLHMRGGAGLLNPFTAFGILRNVISLMLRIIRERTHIVHGYLYMGNMVAAFIGKLTGVPIIITGRRSLSTYKTQKWTPLHRLFEIIANRWTDLIIANSSAVKDDIVLNERIDPSQVMVIYNGVRWEQFQQNEKADSLSSELRLREGAKVIGMIANLIHYKNHEMLIRALPLVRAKISPIQILCVGRDSGIRSELESLSRELGVDDIITWTGSRKDVARILQLMNVSVLTSLEEGFPNAVLESMASGIPVVATRVGGVPEAVIDGRTGFLVDSRDHGSLADRLIQLLTSDTLAKEMGDNARKRVQEDFSMEKMICATEEAYKELLKSKGIL